MTFSFDPTMDYAVQGVDLVERYGRAYAVVRKYSISTAEAAIALLDGLLEDDHLSETAIYEAFCGLADMIRGKKDEGTKRLSALV